MKRYPVRIHGQTHLNDGIGSLLFARAKSSQFIGLVDLEIKVGDIIIDYLGIAAVGFSDLFVQVPLEVLSDLGIVGRAR